MFGISALIGLVLLLAGCAPAISKESLRRVDPDLTFQALIKDPDQYKGKFILAGGRIVSASVREGETWVEVLQQPLDGRQRPRETDASYGRFLIRFEGFADPAIYVAGKKITVVGEIGGKKLLPLLGMEYAYPLLFPHEHYLWKPEDFRSGPSFHFGIGIGGVIR